MGMLRQSDCDPVSSLCSGCSGLGSMHTGGLLPMELQALLRSLGSHPAKAESTSRTLSPASLVRV